MGQKTTQEFEGDAVFRVCRTKNMNDFTVLPTDFLWDRNVSLEGKAVLTYLHYKKQQREDCSTEELVEQLKLTETEIIDILNDLVMLKYVTFSDGEYAIAWGGKNARIYMF